MAEIEPKARTGLPAARGPISGGAVRFLWLLGGFLLVFGVVSLPSIGMFVLPGAVVVMILAGVLSRGQGWPLFLIGAALPMFWVAWLHRGGPGIRRWQGQTSSGASELLNPWPFSIAGVVLLTLAVLLILRRRALRR